MASALGSALPEDDPASLMDVGYRVAAAQARELSHGGHTVLGDAVNAVPEARALWGAAALVVEVVCSDRAAHRARVEARRGARPDAPDWAMVTARRWVPWDETVLRLDSAGASPEALAARLWESLA